MQKNAVKILILCLLICGGATPTLAAPHYVTSITLVDTAQPIVNQTFSVKVSIAAVTGPATNGSFVAQFQGKSLPYPDHGQATQIVFNARGGGGSQIFPVVSATAGTFPLKAEFLGPVDCSGKLVNGHVDCHRPLITTVSKDITVSQPTGSMDLVCATAFTYMITPSTIAPTQCGSVVFSLQVTNTGPTEAFGQLNYTIGSYVDTLTCNGNLQGVTSNIPKNQTTPPMAFPPGQPVDLPVGDTNSWGSNPAAYVVTGGVWRTGLNGPTQPAACHELKQTITPIQ